MRNDGLVLVYGALAGFTLELGVADLLFRGVRVHGFWCAPRNPTLPYLTVAMVSLGFTLELGVADLLFRGMRVHGFWCAPCHPALPQPG